MSITTQLFEGKTIRLGPIDHEKDPEVESRWTHDLILMRVIDRKVAQPLSVAQVKKKYEAIEKEMEESKRMFHFTIRGKEDNRLLGYVRIEWIEWTHATGFIQVVIGDPAERGKGYGSEVLQLMLRYAFAELNLYRLSAVLGEDNPGALRFFQRHGFIIEVRRRKSLLRDGKAWDLLHLGILQDEWLAAQGKEEAQHE